MPRTDRERRVWRVANAVALVGVALWIALFIHAEDPPTWFDVVLSTAAVLCFFPGTAVAIWLTWKWRLFP